MAEHPSAFRLDAHAAGEGSPEVASHVAGCSRCRGYVDALVADRDALLAARPPEAFARQIRQRLDASERPRARSWRWAGLPWAPLGVLAAAVVLIVAVGGPPGGLVPRDPGAVRLKGAPSLAVIVQRGDVQTRHTGAVALRPGDRVRFELTLPARAVVTVGVLDEADASWLPLAESAGLDTGVHVLEGALRVDPRPMRARVLAGPPDAVARARSTGDLRGVVSVPLTSPGAP